jgi:hypothetical protein
LRLFVPAFVAAALLAAPPAVAQRSAYDSVAQAMSEGVVDLCARTFDLAAQSHRAQISPDQALAQIFGGPLWVEAPDTPQLFERMLGEGLSPGMAELASNATGMVYAVAAVERPRCAMMGVGVDGLHEQVLRSFSDNPAIVPLRLLRERPRVSMYALRLDNRAADIGIEVQGGATPEGRNLNSGVLIIVNLIPKHTIDGGVYPPASH